MEIFNNVNFLMVLVATIMSQIVGALWYSSILFGNIWIKMMGFTSSQVKEMKKKSMTIPMIVSFISNFILISILAAILNAFNITSILKAISLSGIIWMGFIATTMIDKVLWEDKSVEFYLINSLHYLVVFILSGVILTL